MIGTPSTRKRRITEGSMNTLDRIVQQEWKPMFQGIVPTLKKIVFSAITAAAVLGPPAIYAGVNLESRLRAQESQEKPWILAEKKERGDSITLTADGGKTAPLASRNIAYLPAPHLKPEMPMDLDAWDDVRGRNSWGYSSKQENSFRKAEGVYRVVLTGDSFSGGGNGFYYWIQRILNKESTTGKTIEVVKLAIEGYNTSDSYGVIKHLALELNPDEVMYQRYTNDPKYTTYEDFAEAPVYPTCENSEAYFSPRTRFWLENGFATYKEAVRRERVFMYDRVFPITDPIANIPVLGWVFTHMFPSLKPCSKVIVNYEYERIVMNEMAQVTEQEGVPLGILWITPFPSYDLDVGKDELFEQVQRDNPDLKISYPRVHMAPFINELGLPKEVLYNRPFPKDGMDFDTHPSVLAHELLAEAYIADVLMKRPNLREHLGINTFTPMNNPREYYVSLIPSDVREHYGIK